MRVVNLNSHFTEQHRQRLVPRAVFHLTCRQTLFDFVKKAVCPAVGLEGSGDSAGLASSPGGAAGAGAAGPQGGGTEEKQGRWKPHVGPSNLLCGLR